MSDYNPHERFFEIAKFGKSALYIGPRPRRVTLGRWSRSLATLGVGEVISFIGQSEVEDYGLAGEEIGLAQHGIDFTHFPIEDFGVPKDPRYYVLVLDSHSHLKSGKTIFAHCASGVGRAGTFASCLLVVDGLDAKAAMGLVSRKRGEVAPETEGQRAFVRAFAP